MVQCTNDFVAVIDATPTSPTFGKITKVVDAPWCGVEAHHCGISADGKVTQHAGMPSAAAGLQGTGYSMPASQQSAAGVQGTDTTTCCGVDVQATLLQNR